MARHRGIRFPHRRLRDQLARGPCLFGVLHREPERSDDRDESDEHPAAIDAQTGGQIDYSKAFIRWLVALVSGLACGLGYLWMLWDPEKQTWQDKVAGTYVVPTSAYPVANWPG